MHPRLMRMRSLLPKGVALWGGITLLLAIGVLTSLADLAATPADEILRANSMRQRVIVDPKTGRVSGLAAVEDEAAFDVDASEESSPEAAPPDEILPTDEEMDTAEDASADTTGATDTSTAPPTEPPSQEPAAATDADATEPAAADATEAPTEPAPAMNADAAVPGMDARLRSSPSVAQWPKVERSSASLVRAPAPEITEKKGKLQLPRTGEKNITPRQLYARSFQRSVEEEQALLAIVITDAGFSAESLQLMLDLPGEITIGISPYADAKSGQIEALRNAGHEVWAMLPLASRRYPQDDPGPYGLLPQLTEAEQKARLYQTLSRTLGSVGVILPREEAISSAAKVWPGLRDELLGRGLLMLSTHPTRAVDMLAKDPEQQALIRTADTVIDATPNEASIRSVLAGLAAETQAEGTQVALISARPQSLRLLKAWLKEKPPAAPVVLAPLSALYAPPAPPEPPAKPKSDESGGH